MSLLLRSSKAPAPFLFWRKSSTKNEPTAPPLRIKVMNRSESEAFFAKYNDESVKSSEASNSSRSTADDIEKSSISQVSTLTDTCYTNPIESESESVTCSDPIALEHSEASVEVPFESSTSLLQTEKKPEANRERKQPTTASRDMSSLAVVPESGAAIMSEAEHVPSNLEILEDLRSKLLSEKLRRRVADLSTTTEPARIKLEPDDTLTKPPKKLPSKSFIEYRRDLFKCNEPYAEADPPGHLGPEALQAVVKADVATPGDRSADGSAVKRPDPDDTSFVVEDYPKPMIAHVPADVKSGEDVAMHEILAAINMFVAPEYNIRKTHVPAESESILSNVDAAAFVDCFGATPSPGKAGGESNGHKVAVEALSESDDELEEATVSSSAGETEAPRPHNVKFARKSPVGVQELGRSPNTPSRSRSMDWTLRRAYEDDCPQDEKTDAQSHYDELEPTGYSSLSRHGSHDESSPLKRSGSEGMLNPREMTYKSDQEKEYGRSVRFHYKDTPLARKIDFGDEESKDGEVDDEDDSAFDDAEHEQYRKHGQYIAFKVRPKVGTNHIISRRLSLTLLSDCASRKARRIKRERTKTTAHR